MGSVIRKKACQLLAPSVSAPNCANAFHQRDQFARDEGECNENRAQNNSGRREDNLDVMLNEPSAEPALGTEEQNVNHARYYRRNGERQTD